MQTCHLLEKSSDITRAVIGRKERAPSEYETRSWVKALTPISSMPDHFPLAFFFSWIKSEFSEQACR